jgi:hypothetical protein
MTELALRTIKGTLMAALRAADFRIVEATQHSASPRVAWRAERNATSRGASDFNLDTARKNM